MTLTFDLENFVLKNVLVPSSHLTLKSKGVVGSQIMAVYRRKHTVVPMLNVDFDCRKYYKSNVKNTKIGRLCDVIARVLDSILGIISKGHK